MAKKKINIDYEADPTEIEQAELTKASEAALSAIADDNTEDADTGNDEISKQAAKALAKVAAQNVDSHIDEFFDSGEQDGGENPFFPGGDANDNEAYEELIPSVDYPEVLTESPAPHIRTHTTTRAIMLDVCIALMPALVWGVYIYGWRALTVTLVSVVFAVLAEFIWEKLLKKVVTVLDFSAVVTGMILALSLPTTVPLWVPAVGAVFAIIVMKQLFGGLGKGILNGALTAKLLLLAIFPKFMTAFAAVGNTFSAFAVNIPDVVASATPLPAINKGALPTDLSLLDAIIGYESGCIGEVSVLLLGAGFVYMLVRRVVTWHIPVAYIGTVFVLTFLLPMGATTPIEFALWQLSSGGLFFGAIFMATDYASSPITASGRIIYGIGCGVLTVLIRYFTPWPEGVCFAILVMNLLSRYIDRLTMKKPFGSRKAAKAK